MSISEIKNYLQTENLISAHVGENVKTYVSGEKIYVNGSWENMINVFGIYKGQDGRYCFFITDSERGIPEYSAVFENEEEACDALIKKIGRAERIYKKNKK